MQEPVKGRGREGLGHELFKADRCGFDEIAMDRFLVSGINETIEALGRVGADFEQVDGIGLRRRRHKCDEVGYIPFDQDAANLFVQLVASRYEHPHHD
ncbi:hypothetical protein [Cryobacterium sp. TMT4-31]|uniref:hypothetical protein n=1 Tax=Cryobacterium sp. TMT4-31 TaxID=1259259 RepID=UPI00351973F2